MMLENIVTEGSLSIISFTLNKLAICWVIQYIELPYMLGCIMRVFRMYVLRGANRMYDCYVRIGCPTGVAFLRAKKRPESFPSGLVAFLQFAH